MNFDTKRQRALEFKTCYACEEPAIDREHCPPKSFFREREKLIMVPSCHVHNGAKNTDDDYMRLYLASMDGSNESAEKLLRTKVKRFLERDTSHQGARFMSRLKNEAVAQVGDRLLMQPDRARFDRHIGLMSRGIYLHETGQKLTGHLLPMPISNDRDSIGGKERWEYYLAVRKEFLDSSDLLGEYPDVFRYRVLHLQSDQVLLELVFYGECRFLILRDKPV